MIILEARADRWLEHRSRGMPCWQKVAHKMLFAQVRRACKVQTLPYRSLYNLHTAVHKPAVDTCCALQLPAVAPPSTTVVCCCTITLPPSPRHTDTTHPPVGAVPEVPQHYALRCCTAHTRTATAIGECTSLGAPDVLALHTYRPSCKSSCCCARATAASSPVQEQLLQLLAPVRQQVRHQGRHCTTLCAALTCTSCGAQVHGCTGAQQRTGTVPMCCFMYSMSASA